ncbi:MerR family transcriptional regulator [Paenibacillus gorillae]|uniref:MerR family transcriptional regulator n=1 Tax=Paenibacillus gorillae TaxID=1243662 RepID=UPI0004AE1AB4|nr:MerR family transcriptional regulator [Paenibacillus gorillae]
MNYSIKEFSLKTGLSAPTLRYYEKEGILPFVKRDGNGNRIYDDENFEWMDCIVALRSSGMPMAEIKHYVDSFNDGEKTIQERKQVVLNHKLRIQNEIMQLNKHLDKVNYKLALYDILEADQKKQNKKL